MKGSWGLCSDTVTNLKHTNFCVIYVALLEAEAEYLSGEVQDVSI
jgi:hypothetical protein